MVNTLTESELTELEKSYWQAIQDRDGDAAERMTSDPCILAGAQGVSAIDSATFVKLLMDPSWQLQDFALSDVQVQPVHDGVAVIAYNVREDLTVEGKPLTLEAADTSMWVRQNDGWRCALHTESILGDPFGRDRHGGTG